MQPPTQNNLSLPAGRNYAPTKPMIDLRDKRDEKTVEDHYLVKGIRNKYDDLISRDKGAWREMINVGQVISNFIEGNQVLEYNYVGNFYTPKKPKPGDVQKIKAINLMQYYVTNLLSKWDSSNPDIYLSPYSNADQAIAKARKANSVVNYLEGKFYNPFFNFQEGLGAICFGWYGRQVETDFAAKSFSALRNVIEEKEVEFGKGYGKCVDCGKSSEELREVQLNPEAERMPQCPECGSLAYDFQHPEKRKIRQVTGQEQIFLPDIICKRLSLPQVRFDIKQRAEESSWFIVEEEIHEGALRRMLGNLRIPEGDGGNDFGMRAMEEMARAGSALGGSSDVSGKDSRRKFTLSKMYLSADDLDDIKIGGEEKTVCGVKLPKGKRMSEAFPEGACCVGVNGMSLVIGLFADHHSKSVSTGVYHVKPLSGVGRGIGDTVEIQKQFNRRYSQIDKWFATRATPGTLHLAGAIATQDRKKLGQPDVDIVVNAQNFPEIRDIRQIIAPLQGEAIDGTLYNHTINNLQNFMQITSHVTDFTGGLGSRVRNSTATGAEILDANADAVSQPALTIKAGVALETAKKGFYLFVNHTPVQRFLPFKQKTKTGSVGIAVSGEDVKGDYEWSTVPGSEEPKNKYTRLKKAVNFFQQFQGGIVGWLQARAQAPKEIAEIERDFDVDFASEGFDAVSELCRNRWEMAKGMLVQQSQLAGVAVVSGLAPEQVPPPPADYTQILLNVRPSMLVTEPAHNEKALWFSQLLDTDEGIECSNEERDLISAFILAHKGLAQGQEIALRQQQAQTELAANQPVQDAQNEQQMAQMAAQAGQQQAQTEHQQTQADEQNAMKLIEMARKEEAENKKMEHEKEVAAMSQGQQREGAFVVG